MTLTGGGREADETRIAEAGGGGERCCIACRFVRGGGVGARGGCGGYLGTMVDGPSFHQQSYSQSQPHGITARVANPTHRVDCSPQSAKPCRVTPRERARSEMCVLVPREKKKKSISTKELVICMPSAHDRPPPPLPPPHPSHQVHPIRSARPLRKKPAIPIPCTPHRALVRNPIMQSERIPPPTKRSIGKRR